ncbi:hypothetical protein IFM89_015946 [Coptis chinensis]|uniref:Wall-associated receptor kinase C-terminal domain-containing protein n=1 Tax=Coptis chinensis TaxID=261450 RepID=A0A835HEY3_9MAGN|nr:hypothetical protein IFM89_015946 [Coptis chinensis]
MKMQTLKNINLLYILYSCLSVAQPTPISFCGEVEIQTPFSLQNSTQSSPLSRILICKSQKLYFRTTLGLLQVSSIDYKAKTLTISHSYCSSSLHFISPSLLSAGFPSPPQSNSVLFFNCSSQKALMSPFLQNCTTFHGCKALSEFKEQKQNEPSTCWMINDTEKVETDFDPKDLNCSHYKRVYRDSASSFSEGYKLGTIISFDIPDHVPNVCDECNKAKGNCGVGLRCICHPKDCRDKVISRGVSLEPFGNIFLSLLACLVMIISLKGC